MENMHGVNMHTWAKFFIIGVSITPLDQRTLIKTTEYIQQYTVQY